jgi:hypothetical protein
MKHKTSKLEDFAGLEIEQLPAVVGAQALPGDRIYGAQRVAVYRDEARVRNNLRNLAAGAGEDWFYRYPVKEQGQASGKFIEGPSIKLANDVARIYGNCDVDVRVFDQGDSWLFYARFLDIETGFSLTRPFVQHKGQSSVKTKDPERARNIAFQIGASKAIRNVVVNALQTYADFAFEEAQRAFVPNVEKKLDHYRNKVAERLVELRIELSAVERSVGRAIGKWTAADVARVIAEVQAIQDGMASAADTFPLAAEREEPAAREAAPEERKATAPKAKAAKAAKKPKAEPKPARAARAAKAAPPAQDAGEAKKAASRQPPQPQTVLNVRAAMYSAKTAADLKRIWTEKVEAGAWTPEQVVALRKTYDEQCGFKRA